LNHNEFCPLHVHTEYSVLDGINKIKPLIERVKSLDMGACAITDHGVLHGIVEFYKEATSQGIKPILGMEAYVTEDKDDLENKDKHRDNMHLVLLAQTERGFQNLMWLNNRAHLRNFYYKPRVCIDHLTRDRIEGLVALSACLGGVIAKHGTYDTATESFLDPEGQALTWARRMRELFGPNFFVEIQPQENWEQTAFNEWAIEMSKAEGFPTVLTTDAHYTRTEDSEVHQFIMAQQFKKTLEEYLQETEMRYDHGDFSIRPPEELYKEAEKLGITEAFWNTRDIAASCNVTLTLGEYQTPEYDVATADDYQDFLSWQERSRDILEHRFNE
jgi:DNA polymerase-3 subunit alpha